MNRIYQVYQVSDSTGETLERIFLAILTFITTFISLFTLHLVDLGMIIKVLYFLDVLSYNNSQNTKTPPTKGDPELFYDSLEQDVEVPSDTKLDSLKKAYQEKSPIHKLMICIMQL